ncbi:helix-turn-helix transcriptional regulator [Aestuariivirga sp.]|uniref:helix-turn-helix transcriptional regulator n=1 Tax=Aestuariivirga sp. TaxID=2650926 RepID=UPI0039E6B61C
MKKHQEYTLSSLSHRLLNEAEAAELLGMSTRALQNWRCRGGGPNYVRLSARCIRYHPGDLAAWIYSKKRGSSSEP